MDHITKPVLKELLPFFFIREELKTLRVLSDELLYLLDTERLILWDGEVLDIICWNEVLGTGDEIFKETAEELELGMKHMLQIEPMLRAEL